MTKTIMEVVNECGLTHMELSQKTGLTYPTIHDIGNGDRPMVRYRTIKIIADAVGMDVSQIRQTGKVMKPKKDAYNTLCWSCIHAVPSKGYGCDWSKYGTPVEGWTAEESTIKTWVGSHFRSYSVKECPVYAPDDGVQRLSDDERGLRLLGTEIIKRAAQDYMIECNKERKKREMDAALLVKRRLYGGNHRHIYDYSENAGMKSLERFFRSDYAEGLSDADCVYIMDRIKRGYGL